MPRHQLLLRLARYFHVVWIDQAANWRDYWLGRDAFRARAIPADPPPGFHFYRPGRWLPEVYKPSWLRAVVRRARLARARRHLLRLGCSRICLYLWRPEFADYVDLVDHDYSCYHVDDEYTFSTVDQPNDAREVALIKRVDQVIVHSPMLFEKKRGINPRLANVPNGVDYQSFAAAYPEPPDLAAVPHPRVGYVGVIKRQLDLALMLSLAKSHPRWSFTFVGPLVSLGEKAGIVEDLERCSNVYFLGNKSVEELPAYIQHMDVCTMCYEVNDYTKYIYPLKLHEYLASGVPVVTSRIASVIPFDDVISIASDEAEWAQHLSRALQPGQRDPAAAAVRRQVAKKFDWNHLASEVAGIFRSGLGRAACSSEGSPRAQAGQLPG
jgi:glycosyltransferase involved in cell wall biosynthesis